MCKYMENPPFWYCWHSRDCHVTLMCHLYRDTRYSWRHNFPFGLGKLVPIYVWVLPRSFTNNSMTLFTWLSRFKKIIWFSAIFPIWKFLRPSFAFFANYIDKHIGISSSAFDITCSDFNFKLCHSKILRFRTTQRFQWTLCNDGPFGSLSS